MNGLLRLWLTCGLIQTAAAGAVYRRAAFAARQAPFHEILNSGEDAGDRQIPGGADHQQRDHLLGTVVDHLDGVEQLRHRQDVHHRRSLGQTDDLVEAGWQDGAQRLRQNNAQRAPPGG